MTPATASRLLALLAAGAAVVFTGCGGDAPAGPPLPPSPSPPVARAAAPLPPPEPGAADRCVELINEYRAGGGLPPLQQSAVLEHYAAEAAIHDGTSRRAHQYFSMTRGAGVATAENEIPWWPIGGTGGVDKVLDEALKAMWGEGPGGGHYENLAGPYEQAGCGIFVNEGHVTIVQAFR